MRGRTFLLGITLTVGLALAGCGSSNTLTKAKFLAKANSICRKGNASLKAAELQFTSAPSKAELEAFIKTTVIPSIQGQITAVKAIGTPSGEESKVTAMLNLAQSELNAVKKDPASYLASTAKPFAKFQKEAKSYGMTACASEEEEGEEG